ncbi:MAG: type II toxin-antitoxin system VapB family antitoxin [Acidimicrobiales bacterium]
MTKTSIEIDFDVAREAGEILGTKTLRATVSAALCEVVNARRRLELIALLGEPGRFDFGEVESAWGGDA